uniref:RNA polymerase II subunit B1 CTD phosphatase RPAP2 homolog n=1 Tax=Syphacia muris TaxID=451379 RepID=A0A0N5AKF3_9BILA
MEIAEERYLGRLCGYPCCSNAVEIRKHQKYRIDRKNKKVFERSTERDKFCSEQCLARFNGLRFQFDDEPLWLRGTRRRLWIFKNVLLTDCVE